VILIQTLRIYKFQKYHSKILNTTQSSSKITKFKLVTDNKKALMTEKVEDLLILESSETQAEKQGMVDQE